MSSLSQLEQHELYVTCTMLLYYHYHPHLQFYIHIPHLFMYIVLFVKARITIGAALC